MLVTLCAAFLVSTVWLYLANDTRQRQIYLSSSSSAWISHQAQVEQNSLQSMLGSCATDAGCRSVDVARQLDQLASRIELMVSAESAGRIVGMAPYASQLEHFAQLARRHSSNINSSAQSWVDAEELAELVQDMNPLAEVIQAALSEAVVQSADDMVSEALPQRLDASVAFILLILSGAGLLAFLALELRQRNGLLQEVNTLRDAERESQGGTVELLEALPVPVLVMAQDRTVRYANHAAKALAAPPRGVEEVAALAATIQQNFGSFDGEGSASRDFPLFFADGSLRYLSVAASGIRLLGESASVYVISDNTMLRDAELRALTAGKLAILGELSSAITHELNQPLAVIKAAAANGKMYAAGLPNAQKVVDKLVRIDEQTDRAKRIIDNVRRLARPNQAHTPFLVSRSLGTTLALVSQQYRLSGVSLEIDIDVADEVTIVGNPTLFEIAILNILLNAREAFNRAEASAVPPTVWIRVRAEAGLVVIVIFDNAGGIPQHILPRVFESFVSSKTAESGTGLGLSIARRAVEGMQGTIRAENAASGAVFSISLPTLVEEAAA